MSIEKTNYISDASLELVKTYLEAVDSYVVYRALQLLRMQKEYSYWRPTTPAYVRDMSDSCIEELNDLLGRSAVNNGHSTLDLHEGDPIVA